MTARRTPRAQRGMAVVSALLIVAAVAAIATGLFQRQAAQMRAVENEQARIQARWLLLGGIDWARLVLRDDARRNSVTRLGELWSTPIADTRIERPGDDRVALFSGRIEDEQGKFNLYNLALAGLPQPDQVAALGRLCAMLGLPASLAGSITLRIASAQPQAASNTPGAAPPPGPAAPMPGSIDDLQGLQGFTDKTADMLRPYVTILPEATPVNANTATAEVLAAVVAGLPLSRARALADQRNAGTWFNSPADFANRAGGPDLVIATSQIVTSSQWFMVTGTVALDRATVTTRALVSRPTAAAAPTIVWKKEVD